MTLKWNFWRDGGVQEKQNLPWEGYGHFLEQHIINLCTSQIKASTSSPPPAGQPPRHLNFWKIVVQVPPSLGRKAVQMPPPSCAFKVGALAYFPNSGWWSSLENYCFYCKDNFNIFTYLIGFRHLQIQNKACVGLWFSTNLPRISIFFFWIHQSLSPPWFINSRGISATCNMTSRLVIKFPNPYEWWSNALPPGQEKASNARGSPEGGGGCWRFDLTGTLF